MGPHFEGQVFSVPHPEGMPPDTHITFLPYKEALKKHEAEKQKKDKTEAPEKEAPEI